MKPLPKEIRYLKSEVVVPVLSLVVLALVSWVPALAQDNTLPNTNVAMEAEALALSNALNQTGELIPPNDLTSNGVPQIQEGAAGQTNGFSDANALAPGEGRLPSGPPESRRQWLLRQRAGAPGPAVDAAQNGDHAATNAAAYADSRPVKPDYSTFRLITDRNIFDPNRRPGRTPGFVNTPAKIAESFALVGVMSYEKGTFAFFDGTSSEYKKALKLADTIAGYKVTKIDPNAVRLAAGTNRMELRVGMQMRREQDGEWAAATQTETYAASSTSPGSASVSSAAAVGTQTAAASGGDSDVLERLRKKREQE